MNDKSKKKSSAISATDLMAQLEDDEDFQRKRKIREEALGARVAELRAAEQPIIRDLRASGVAVDSVWDLVGTATPYPDALPVLMHHLEVGGYPDRVAESLGRALAVKPSIIFWSRLEKLYLSSRSRGEREGAAIALAAVAGPEQTDTLIAFLRASELAETRIYFVSPLLRISPTSYRRTGRPRVCGEHCGGSGTWQGGNTAIVPQEKMIPFCQSGSASISVELGCSLGRGMRP